MLGQRLERNDLAEYLPEKYFLDEVLPIIENRVYNELRKVIEITPQERAVQKVLEENPKLMGMLLSGHLGRWVVPQKRLGSEYIPDFVIGEESSEGISWTTVELESPMKKMFNKNGDPSATLNHAIRQIVDWRAWLSHNRAYAERKTTRGGLGLFGIRPKLPGIILVGRRRELKESDIDRRTELSEQLNIKIHTYDWLIEKAALFSGNLEEINQARSISAPRARRRSSSAS